MPYSSSGAYTAATGATTAFSGQVIASATWNAIFTDLQTALSAAAQFSNAPGATLTLVNGLNSNITAPTRSFMRVTGPTGAFSLGGFAPPSGMAVLIRVYNPLSLTMTIVNEDGSSSATNRIKTLTGGNVVLRATQPSSVTLVYDTTDLRWILTGSS